MSVPNVIEQPSGDPSVVPASLVVASDREDFPLTQAGLVAAIAALPAGGGTIYIGEGTLVVTAPIALSKNVKLIGAGVGITIFSVTTGISVFTAGDVGFTMSDFSVIGNNTAAQAFLTLTASASTGKFGMIERVQVGTVTGFGTDDGTKIFIDAATFTRVWYLNDLTLVLANGSSFYANGAGGTMRAANVSGVGAITGSLVMDAVNFTVTTNGTFAFGNQGKFSNCRFTGVSFTAGTQTLVENSFLICDVTVGNESLVTNSFIQCTTTTLGTSCVLRGINLIGAVSAPASCVLEGVLSTGALTATGSKVKVTGCTFTTFTSATAGADNHVLKGNTFTGAGNNVILTDCDGCVVEGNISCQVQETASSDSNRFNDNQGFAGSTIIGPNSVVNGAKRFGGTGAVADAYATLFTVTNPKGILGYGVIKNTDGADGMIVEEQGIDAFGVTAVRGSSTIAAGDEKVLDPTDFLDTARPPYTSYRVRVKNASAGNNAAYSVQFVSQGDMT